MHVVCMSACGRLFRLAGAICSRRAHAPASRGGLAELESEKGGRGFWDQKGGRGFWELVIDHGFVDHAGASSPVVLA